MEKAIGVQKIGSTGKDKWVRVLCTGLAFFLVVFAFYATFMGEDLFTDETDNFAVWGYHRQGRRRL